MHSVKKLIPAAAVAVRRAAVSAAPIRCLSAAAASEVRPFKVLGLQQIAVGGLSKGESQIAEHRPQAMTFIEESCSRHYTLSS
jgi:hypothetical protein